MIRLLLPMSAVELKEVVQSAICESTVDFRPVDRYVTVCKFHADVFAGVVIIMKFYLNSGTGESARELIPRLTAINRLTDPLRSLNTGILSSYFCFSGEYVSPYLSLRAFTTRSLRNEIVALVDCLA